LRRAPLQRKRHPARIRAARRAVARDQAKLPEEQITYEAPAGTQALDNETISHWLDRNGASGWLRTLIEVAYTCEMGLQCDQQSALNFLTFIDPDTTKFKIFAESDERFHVRGGNDLIVHGLAAKLGDANPYRLRARSAEPGRRRHVHIEFQAWCRLRLTCARAGSCSRCRSRCCANVRITGRPAAGETARDCRIALWHERKTHDRLRRTSLAHASCEQRQQLQRSGVADDMGNQPHAGRRCRHPYEFRRRAGTA
jgi:hypothetical protein